MKHASTGIRSRMRLRQLVGEAVAGVIQRPGRAALTATGTVLGIGALVATAGLTATANGQIAETFNKYSATEIHVHQASTEGEAEVARPVNPFPADAEARLLKVVGVEKAGTYSLLTEPDVRSNLRSATNDLGDVNVYAVSEGFWRASRTTVSGRTFDRYLQTQHVAVIGEGLAATAAIPGPAAGAAIIIRGIPFTVVGIVTDSERLADLPLSIAIPNTVAERLWGGGIRPTYSANHLVAETRLGAARVVAGQAALALRPDAPGAFSVDEPSEPTRLRDAVSANLNALLLGLSALLLITGAVGIANTTLVSVMERVPEIGLRRAVGALPRHIAGQFLLETTLLGGLGGLLGTSLGVLVTIATAWAMHWTALMDPRLLLAGPALGALAGLVAGLYPASRAARLEPAEAIRR